MSTIEYSTAGGLVLDDATRVLVLLRDIERNGRMIHEVRLPKGMIEEGETPRDAAVREVCEESGFCHLIIVADLGKARSEYPHAGNEYSREEQYYLMRLSEDRRSEVAPVNDEEALFRPDWRSLQEALETMTYESEREFIRRAQLHLAGDQIDLC